MKPGTRNLPASVLNRLRNFSKETNQTFDEVLTYYGLERFLYRVSVSEHRDSFVLKGAMVMVSWDESPRRLTRDMDFRTYIQPDIENVMGVMKDICQIKVEPDAIRFDPVSVLQNRL